jgi:hypothetical protein
MPLFRPMLLAVGAFGVLLAAPAAQAGGPNVAVCWTLSNQFNQCVRDYQYPRQGYGRDWNDGGWGGGGGYGGGWDGDNWQGRRRLPRRGDAAAACQGWLIQMKAANCF